MLAAIALGSNLSSRFGSPRDNLKEALRRLQAFGEVLQTSGFFLTEPVGFLDQPAFMNAATLLETRLEPRQLLRALLGTEAAMGRVRSPDATPKGPRIIDLDLLLCRREDGTGCVLATPELTVPHPALAQRRFVLEPLSEIASDWIHPVSGRSIAQLRAELGACP